MLLFLLVLVSGCAGPRKLMLPSHSAPVSKNEQALPGKEESESGKVPASLIVAPKLAKAHLTRVSSRALELPVETKPTLPASCSLPDTYGAQGFYRDDAFDAGQVVLTFDDGPHPGKTPKVLAALADHGFPATFFVVGRVIRRDTYHLLQEMVAAGHSLGVHSYNHDVKMAERGYGHARTVRYVQGQHHTTHLLIELALLARSPDEFDGLFARVFAQKPGTYLKSSWLRDNALRAEWSARHARILRERGYEDGERPYPMLYSRPPGGGPYLGKVTGHRAVYDEALANLGFLNVMWHGGSGDVHPERRKDHDFLVSNIEGGAKRGGVFLIHDYIRSDALRLGLARIAKDPKVEVITLDQAVQNKFGCAAQALREVLAAQR